MITLGCAKNTVDAEIMLGDLKERKFIITNNPAEADILIVNTCGFIETAKQESINTVLEMAEWKENGNCKALIVTGCLTQRYGEEILAEMPEVDGVFGTGTFHRLVEGIERVLSGERVLLVGEATFDYETAGKRLRVTPNHSAYVKIAEGCNNRCSYCAIPLVRGDFHSRSKEHIVEEVRALAQEQVVEVNLIAQDTTRYGLDRYGSFELTNLLRDLIRVDGVAWYRLLYCYPTHFTDELIELIATEDRVLNYLDLPLQHINPRILKDMRRPHDVEAIRSLLNRLRERIPDLTLRTSFIVGFPGETEAEFQELAEFLQDMQFDHVGVFTYSQEEGTAAASRDDQIAESVKEQRRDHLMRLQQPISRARNQRFAGRTIEVLVEEAWREGKGITGRSRKDAPDVDGLVYVRDCSAKPGELILVDVEAARDYDLLGVIHR